MTVTRHWVARVCPVCDRLNNTCEHIEFQGVEPVEVVVVPASTLDDGGEGAVERVARERLRQAIAEGRFPHGTVWDGHYLTAAGALIAAYRGDGRHDDGLGAG